MHVLGNMRVAEMSRSSGNIPGTDAVFDHSVLRKLDFIAPVIERHIINLILKLQSQFLQHWSSFLLQSSDNISKITLGSSRILKI